MKKPVALLLALALALSLAACGGTTENNDTVPGPQESTEPPQSDGPAQSDEPSGEAPEPPTPDADTLVEAPGSGPADASRITSVEGVPLITLNNGVQMPQFGLGTQIQSLENGDLGVLNETSREAVAAALRSGYRHLDDAHGYLQERGVGQGIRDSGVPREEIWITDKCPAAGDKGACGAVQHPGGVLVSPGPRGPAAFERAALESIAAAHDKSVVQIIVRWHIQEGISVIPGSTNPDHIQENIEIFDFELTDEEMELIRAMDQGESGRYFNINYDYMGGMFSGAPREWEGDFE